MGKTILISSHILPELADLCNKVGIIEQGELIYSGSITDAVRKARVGTVVHVSVANAQPQAAALISTLPNVENEATSNGMLVISLKQGIDDYTFVPQALLQSGFRLTMLKEEEVKKARRIIEAMLQAQKEGKGAVALDGKLIDNASIKQAQVMVDMAERVGMKA